MSKEYTAQDYRQMVCDLENNRRYGMERVVIASLKLIDMVRQAAEMRERLDAVVKVAKEQFDIIFHSPMCWDEDENESHSLEQLKEMDALEMVVATARGDAGKEKR